MLFHSCTILGLIDLFENFRTDLPVCVSSERSQHLFGRNAVIVLDLQIEDCDEYETSDIDSGYRTAWDEGRISFSSVEDFASHVVEVIVTDDSYNAIKALENGEELDYEEEGVDCSGEDFQEWLYSKIRYSEIENCPVCINSFEMRDNDLSKEFLNF